MKRFKRAKFLAPEDRIFAYADGVPSESIVFSTGTMPGERGKPRKAQHMATGNLATGVHVIFQDGSEALLHPDEQIEVLS